MHSLLKNIFIIVACLLLSLPARISASSLPFPVFSRPEKSVFSARFEDERSADSRQQAARRIILLETPKKTEETIMPAIAEGKKQLTLQIKVETHGGNLGWTEFRFQEDSGQLKMLSYYSDLKTPQGKLLRQLKYNFNHPALNYPPYLYHPLSLPMGISALIVRPSFKCVFFSFLNPMAIERVDVVSRGVEKITVPAGEYMCRKVTIRPKVADYFGPMVAGAVQSFLPKFELWFSVEPPYRRIKERVGASYMPSLSTPFLVQELVSNTTE